LSKDSWDQFIKIFVWFFFWSHCSNPWMNWKISKQFNLWLSENFQYFEKRFQFQKILFRNQCRNKWAFKRYALCCSVFSLRRVICIHPKWITIYPYLSIAVLNLSLRSGLITCCWVRFRKGLERRFIELWSSFRTSRFELQELTENFSS
jgi:hypothetical protein